MERGSGLKLTPKRITPIIYELKLHTCLAGLLLVPELSVNLNL
jgi:hypothetical protein